jgi:IS1 family transposase/transposase-like protein
MMKTDSTRSPIESLACVEPDCDLYGQPGQGNLTVRKVYGRDKIRYLRCNRCRVEFSERKGSALWNTKVREAKAVSVAAHLSEGCSQESIVRLVDVDISVVQRLNGVVGKHGRFFHDEHVREIKVEALEADERYGFSATKRQAAWEAEVMDAKSKLIVAHEQGRCDEALIRRLYSDAAQRVADRHALVLFTDGEASYATLFPEYFGVAYQPRRNGCRGRGNPLGAKFRYRIPRALAHVQIVKRREGARVVEVDVRYTHGSRKRAWQALDALGYTHPNTSAIERRNGTARAMSIYQVRKSIAFAHRADVKLNLGWWGVTVYNWCRPHRSLRLPIAAPKGKKSTNSALRPWPRESLITFSQSGNSCSHRSIQPVPGDNLT